MEDCVMRLPSLYMRRVQADTYAKRREGFGRGGVQQGVVWLRAGERGWGKQVIHHHNTQDPKHQERKQDSHAQKWSFGVEPTQGPNSTQKATVATPRSDHDTIKQMDGYECVVGESMQVTRWQRERE